MKPIFGNELASTVSVRFLGLWGGGSVWSGLVLPFFLRAVGIFRPTPIFERGQMLLLPLPQLRVVVAAFVALAAAAAVVAVAAPVAPAVAVGGAAVAAAVAAPALETTQRRVAWPLRKDDYAQVENWINPARFVDKFLGANFWILALCPVGVFWSCFAYVFALLCCLVLPKVA